MENKKSILEIDEPVSCHDCQLVYEYNWHTLKCFVTKEDVDDCHDHCHRDCPLMDAA